MNLKLKYGILILLFCQITHAQDTLKLKDLTSFQPSSENWKIVGALEMAPWTHFEEHFIEKNKSRKCRKNRTKVEVNAPVPVKFQNGEAILYNNRSVALNSPSVPNFNHGDMLLEFDFMVGSKTSSRIYFQGNYELRISDSCEKKKLTYSDMGRIYKSADVASTGNLKAEVPTVNTALAPGLWQQLKVHFKAPTFDTKGNKISNARFIFIDFNGYRIHEKIAIPFPTENSLFKKHVPLDPILFRQANGHIAYRNFKITKLREPKLNLENLSYKAYLKDFMGLEEI